MPSSRIESRYKCCCGCCRSTTGAVLVGILDIVTAAVLLWHGLAGKFVLFSESQSEYEKPLRQGSLGGAGLFGGIGLLAVFAVICRLPCLLIFHMVVNIAALLGFGLLAALVSVIAFVANEEHGQWERDNTNVIIFLSCLGASALLQIWCFLITLSAYRALSEDYPGSNGAGGTNGVYSMVPSNGSATANTHAYYYPADGTGDGQGVPVSSSYTPMLSTPNYYKQQPLYTASSPPMYG